MEQRLDSYSSIIRNSRASIHFRLLGILPLVFFLLQGIHYWKIGEFGNMLWMCNIGNLMLALGMFFENAMLIRVSVLWMIPGLVVWLIYVVWAWGVFFSSTLAHVGGMIVGLIALRKVGMDKRAWLYALMWYFAVQVLSRFLTSPALNVNLAHAIDPGWQRTFSSYLNFWLVLTLAVSTVLWLLGFILGWLFPIKPK
ncbi:MAG TPA: hypothetical protein VE135_26360 [Pyrinomonadaceae bacterium]|nr:hypothetical protein [Pyrinomonadaceae bacterium]